ncbi:malonate decarboxylase subunit epsilon [Domibacillus epiphyticus]|uniref:Malonyl CoA-acyl carrier protein transacylase n=1 Tax=Domibacillus epiphyticus TaxID=1714355 RepID=A0A1V2ABC2_9BACI|nr:malonate decarboxylase subunit epsilon [Domibacillus epiphyticus]OMP68298.1 malonate decarboxylase subunit epsilon [Domibacillus epiphyticus]
MKIAFLFPGQGSQKPGLLNDLPHETSVKKVLDEASSALNVSVYNLQTKEALSSTTSVQISLLTAGVAAFKAFEAEGIKPDYVAGHSVGAFSAAVAAGVIDFRDALRVVKIRGELMERKYPQGYGMGVVLGMDEDKLQSLVSQAYDEKHPVFMSNKNAPDQITISGSLSGIQRVLDEARQKGASKASMLDVSTPSHCPLLSSVSEELAEALHDIPFHRPFIPYAGNRRARLLFDPVDIRLDLAESVSSAVQWHDASVVLYENGARLLIEMPPGNVLARLAAKAFPEARVMSVTENGFSDCQYIAQKNKRSKK